MEKIILVGGSKGIGKEIIKQLGSTYEILNISRTAPEDVNISEHFALDITKDEIPKIAAANHLIYCPGTINLKPISSLKIEDFQRDMEVNLFGAVKAIKAYHRILSKEQNSSITLFSTVAVKQGMPFHSSVAAAKGAIEGLTRSLAAELAPKIRVNCIAPTITNTPLASNILRNDAMIEKMNERHPMKHILQPEELAAVAEFLISSKAKNITGQVLGIDGGLSTLKI